MWHPRLYLFVLAALLAGGVALPFAGLLLRLLLFLFVCAVIVLLLFNVQT